MAARSRSVNSIVIIVALASGLVLLLAERFTGHGHDEGTGHAGEASGELSACYDEGSAALRVIDPHDEACQYGERALYWFPGNPVGAQPF